MTLLKATFFSLHFKTVNDYNSKIFFYRLFVSSCAAATDFSVPGQSRVMFGPKYLCAAVNKHRNTRTNY